MALNRQAAISLANQERRREAARKGRFASIISTPEDLGTVAAGNPASSSLTLPAGAYIGISIDSGCTAGQLEVATSTGRTLATPALAADEIHRLGFLERDVAITPESAVAGTVSIYYFDEWRVPYEIATGVFS